MKGLNLKGFTRIHSDKTTTTLAHPDGHKITIAHSAVSPELRKQLTSLPRMAFDEGGGVGDFVKGATESFFGAAKSKDLSSNDYNKPSPTPSAQPNQFGEGNGKRPAQAFAEGGQENASSELAAQDTPEAIAADAAQQPEIVYGTAAPKEPEAAPEAPVADPNDTTGGGGSGNTTGDRGPVPSPSATVSPSAQPDAGGPPPAPQDTPPNPNAQAPVSDPYGIQKQQEYLNAGIGSQLTGNKLEAKALGAVADAQAIAQHAAVENQQQQARDYQDHFNQLDQERHHFQDDINNFHVDPNHYLNSMGTGDRIASGIGLFLAGFDPSGHNSAAKFIDDQIGRDIDAQKAELGKKENLLSSNLRQFGNLKDATDMTRVMQNDIVNKQIQEAAMKQGGALANAQALKANGLIEATNAQTMGQMAMRRTMLSGMQNGTVNPGQAINAIVPVDQRTAALKELKDSQDSAAARDNLVKGFDEAKEMLSGAGKLNPQNYTRIKAKLAPLIGEAAKDETGRANPFTTGELNSQMPAMTDTDKTSEYKRAALIQIANAKRNYPITASWGIHLGNSPVSGIKQNTKLPPKGSQ